MLIDRGSGARILGRYSRPRSAHHPWRPCPVIRFCRRGADRPGPGRPDPPDQAPSASQCRLESLGVGGADRAGRTGGSPGAAREQPVGPDLPGRDDEDDLQRHARQVQRLSGAHHGLPNGEHLWHPDVGQRLSLTNSLMMVMTCSARASRLLTDAEHRRPPPHHHRNAA